MPNTVLFMHTYLIWCCFIRLLLLCGWHASRRASSSPQVCVRLRRGKHISIRMRTVATCHSLRILLKHPFLKRSMFCLLTHFLFTVLHTESAAGECIGVCAAHSRHFGQQLSQLLGLQEHLHYVYPCCVLSSKTHIANEFVFR